MKPTGYTKRSLKVVQMQLPPHNEFWGYWGTCQDRFGVRWMFNVMKAQ